MLRNMLRDVVPPEKNEGGGGNGGYGPGEKRSIRDIPLSTHRRSFNPTPSIAPGAPLPRPKSESILSRMNLRGDSAVPLPRPIKPRKDEMGEDIDDIDTATPEQKKQHLMYKEPKDDLFEDDGYYGTGRSRFSRIVVIVGAIVIFFGGVTLIAAFFFSGAKVIVTPKQQDVVADNSLIAYTAAKPGELQYEVMTLNKAATKTVAATKEEMVSRKASGTIIIYNNFSPGSQALVKNTRFETPQGLIYRIDNAITIPGTTQKDGKTVPGSLEVTVFADAPGDSYNIPVSDFTIPGFKGSPRFQGFYARSKTAMVGGFSGMAKIIDPSVVAAATAELTNELKAEILKEANAQKPDGFVFYDGGAYFDFPAIVQEQTDKGVKLTQSATFHGVLFDKNKLAQALATELVDRYDGTPVSLLDSDTPLTLTPAASTTDTVKQPWNTDSFAFTLTGGATLRWTFDETKLKNDLAGKQKSAITQVLTQYPSIDKAEVVLRPFWKTTIPEDPTKIRVETAK